MNTINAFFLIQIADKKNNAILFLHTDSLSIEPIKIRLRSKIHFCKCISHIE